MPTTPKPAADQLTEDAPAAAKAKPVKAPAKPRKAATKRGVKPNSVLADDHTPSEAVAHAIRMEFGDLSPSVNRIMNAGLHEAGTMHAITLFRESLGVRGDENRNPLVAIEAGRLIPDEG
ncbi:MAG: hypothetical protein WCC60_07705 [Ilumatobacteraceae bacterium]